jgi:hypothetical protein
MTPFQWISLASIAVILVIEVLYGFRRSQRRLVWLIRCGIWVAAAVAIAQPNLTSRIALLVGIQRGADLVSYLAILAFLWVAFQGYSRYVRMEQQITVLVRRLATLEAQRAAETSDFDMSRQGERQTSSCPP